MRNAPLVLALFGLGIILSGYLPSAVRWACLGAGLALGVVYIMWPNDETSPLTRR